MEVINIWSPNFSRKFGIPLALGAIQEILYNAIWKALMTQIDLINKYIYKGVTYKSSLLIINNFNCEWSTLSTKWPTYNSLTFCEQPIYVGLPRLLDVILVFNYKYHVFFSIWWILKLKTTKLYRFFIVHLFIVIVI